MERPSPQLDAPEALCERARLVRSLGFVPGIPEGLGHERKGTGWAIGVGELKRSLDPARHELAVGTPLPHSLPGRCLGGELAVELGERVPFG